MVSLIHKTQAFAQNDANVVTDKQKKSTEQITIKDFAGAIGVILGALIAWGLPNLTSLVQRRRKIYDDIRAAEIVCLGRLKKMEQAILGNNLDIYKREVQKFEADMDTYLKSFSAKITNDRYYFDIYDLMVRVVIDNDKASDILLQEIRGVILKLQRRS